MEEELVVNFVHVFFHDSLHFVNERVRVKGRHASLHKTHIVNSGDEVRDKAIHWFNAFIIQEEMMAGARQG